MPVRILDDGQDGETDVSRKYLLVLAMRDGGLTFVEIGEYLDVSVSRARAIYERASVIGEELLRRRIKQGVAIQKEMRSNR